MKFCSCSWFGRIRVSCSLGVILFWMVICVLWVLFHVLLVVVVFLVSMVRFCAYGYGCCSGDAERRVGKWW